jgi:hypothetical protein
MRIGVRALSDLYQALAGTRTVPSMKRLVRVVAFAFEPLRGGGEIAWNWRF